VRLRDYKSNFTSSAMSRVGKKYEVQKGGGNKYHFRTIIYTPDFFYNLTILEFILIQAFHEVFSI
jgi:hypothetical protein